MNTPNTSDKRPILVWFRNDLRTGDHPALFHATQTGRPILAVYMLDEKTQGIRHLGGAQKWFLHHALNSLKTKLQEIGGDLHLFEGDSEKVIASLVQSEEIGAVYWNRRCGGKEIETDSKLKSDFTEHGLEVRSFLGNLLHEPYKVKTGSDGPYRVYSPFWRALEAKGEPRESYPAPEKIIGHKLSAQPHSLSTLNLLPQNPDWAKGWEDIWDASEQGALDTLNDFLEKGIHGYKTGRDFPDRENTSRLSPYLRFGMISPYQVWHGVRHRSDAENIQNEDAQKFLKELAWREFSYHLLFHYPDLGWKNFQERFDEFPWRTDAKEHLTAWQKGQTGYPIVDAGMRELWQTGYMHNRVRMVVGSFLVKHLLIDWREGEKWFWDTLVDGDPANNTASWQWIAGCGADAAPYFRIFNPMLQGAKFDPEGTYVKRYVPELADLPKQYVHAPFDAPKEILERYNITLGKTYPHPIVEHSHGRERALSAFQELKKAG